MDGASSSEKWTWNGISTMFDGIWKVNGASSSEKWEILWDISGIFMDILLGLRWYLHFLPVMVIKTLLAGFPWRLVGWPADGYGRHHDGIVKQGKTSDISRLMDDFLDMIMDMNVVSMEVWYYMILYQFWLLISMRTWVIDTPSS